VTDPLEDVARSFAAALPASVVMPAGAGKTHLLAATARHAVGDGGRVLVLTHTNAGVHAIQHRLKSFGVFIGVRVMTVTSFAFTLARAYPHLGGIQVPPTPHWADSADYIEAARRITRARHVKRVLSASFTHLLVDEYQDCSEMQHAFVCALAEAIPATGTFGDPLQAIFGFRDPLPAWSDVLDRFPEHPLIPEPWRWKDHNPALGEWLTNSRPKFVGGQRLDFSAVPASTGIRYECTKGDFQVTARTALYGWPADDTVLILTGPGKGQPRSLARSVQGRYSVMEEIGAEFMGTQLDLLGGTEPSGYAAWLFDLTKECFTGTSKVKLDSTFKRRLDECRTVSTLKRPGLTPAVLKAFDLVSRVQNFASLVAAMDVIKKVDGLTLHSQEAWHDIQTSIRGAIGREGDRDVLGEELAKARDRIRHLGRTSRRRVVSRTVLVKGLEYDHVIIANVSQITDANNLYVALTRARKSIVVMGDAPVILLTTTSTGRG
jgi:hypothetical protein